jgi:hypothetical protein
MKKIVFLISAVILITISGLAQEGIHYGIFLGGSVNWMAVDSKLYYDDSEVNTIMISGDNYEVSYLTVNDAHVKPNYGFTIGGIFEYRATKRLGLQFELLYNKTGYILTGNVRKKNIGDDEYVTYAYKSNTKMDNVSASVMARVFVFNQLMSIDLGVQPSYCFRMIKETERGINHKSVVYTSDTEYAPFNLNAIGGVTVNVFENVFVSARFTMGFMDLIKQKTPYLESGVDADDDIHFTYNDAESKVRSVLITVGFRIK